MAKFIIQGGKKLSGTVQVSGNKNSALSLLPAALLLDGKTTLVNVPQIRDIEVMIEILENLGARATKPGRNRITIDPSGLSNWKIPVHLAGRIRGSVNLIAPLLSRFGRVLFPLPGGDSIGERVLGTHFSMLKHFGVEVKSKNGVFEMRLKNPPKRVGVFLEEASVTATQIGLMLAASQKTEVTILDAACEPHVIDLAEFLNKAGARIENAGNQTIHIKGNPSLKAVSHRVRPEHVEVGTFAIAAAITGGKVRIKDAFQEDLRMISLYLEKMGVKQRFLDKKTLEVLPSELVVQQKKFQTRPWPGFPTDLMSPFIVLATQTKGTALCHDWMYEWRVFFVDYLILMGADIVIADPHRIIVNGPTKLHGEYVASPDIRAGAALLLAALAAKGESVVDHAEIIERGYEKIEEKLVKLGAEIKKTE